MRIKVGAYELDGEFKSRKQAKEIFTVHYPLVTEEKLELELDKLFKDADKSGNTSEKVADSNQSNTETGEGGTGRKQSGKSKH